MEMGASREERVKSHPTATAIIQARMQSVRLPGKSMRELAGKPLISHVIERALCMRNIDTVVLATASGEENAPLVKLAESMNCKTFIGSEHNVLERYYFASRKFGGDFIVRITGDNPFVDIAYAEIIIEKARTGNHDLCSALNLPLGTAVEVIRNEALERAYEQSSEPYHFEHVTPYIKEHPHLFSIERHPVNLSNPFTKIRLTVDTPEDYELAQILYSHLYHGKPFSIHDIISFLMKHPALVKINSGISQRPMHHSEKGHVP